jgi:hypothetical protein
VRGVTQGPRRTPRRPFHVTRVFEVSPYLLQLEFFHALLIWRDGRALDADIVLENRLHRLDHYLTAQIQSSLDMRSICTSSDRIVVSNDPTCIVRSAPFDLASSPNEIQVVRRRRVTVKVLLKENS